MLPNPFCSRPVFIPIVGIDERFIEPQSDMKVYKLVASCSDSSLICTRTSKTLPLQDMYKVDQVLFVDELASTIKEGQPEKVRRDIATTFMVPVVNERHL